MKYETTEAFCRLTSLFVKAILDAGSELPEGIDERLATDPRKACEELNALALSCGAVTGALDHSLAMVYQGMDAADARTQPGEQDTADIHRAFERAVRLHEIAAAQARAEEEARAAAERAAAEQAAAERAAAEQAAKEAAELQPAEPPAEQAAEEKPRKRRGRKPKNQAAQLELSVPTEEPAVNAAAAEAAVEPVAAPAPIFEAAEAESVPNAAPAAEAETSPEPTPEPANAPEPAPEAVAEAKPAAEPAAQADDGATLSADQAAAILGVTKPEVYKLIKAGELPAVKKGRSWHLSAAAVTAHAAQQ